MSTNVEEIHESADDNAVATSSASCAILLSMRTSA